MTATRFAVERSDDPRLDPYRDIRERDLRRRDGLFVAEGTVVLEALSRSDDFGAVSLLVLENRVNGIAHILDGFGAHVPAYIAPRAVIDSVAGFPMHRSVLALARRNKAHEVGDLLRNRPDRVLLLCNLANHDNVGACFRIASAFGVGAVIADKGTADPLYRKAIRVSTGAVLRVPHVHGGTIEQHIETVRRLDYRVIALSPGSETAIDRLDLDRPIVLLVGSEGPGLPSDLIESLDTAAIRMAQGHDSLNVATSAAIALYELAKQRR